MSQVLAMKDSPTHSNLIGVFLTVSISRSLFHNATGGFNCSAIIFKYSKIFDTSYKRRNKIKQLQFCKQCSTK